MICTTIEQSKRLIELGIDRKTSNMYYWCGSDLRIGGHRAQDEELDVPAWSLTALFSLIKDKCGYFEFVYLKRTYDGRANPLDDVYRLSTDEYDVYNKEAVDACYEMIIKLNELKIL